MIKRHERTQLFRELPRDCCSSLVTSLSEQKKSPVLQGDRQLLGSVRESLIAAGGGSHALMCAVTLRGGAGEKATLTISVPKALGPAAKPSTQVASLSLFTVPWVFFFSTINCSCLCSKIELSWVSLLDCDQILTATGSPVQPGLHQIFRAGLDPDPTGKVMLAQALQPALKMRNV